MNDKFRKKEIVAVLFGRGNSKGLPGKNTMTFLGRPLMEFPICAVSGSSRVGARYVSTDSDVIAGIAMNHSWEKIDRPDFLCTDEALLEDAIVHASDSVLADSPDVKLMVILLCNAPNVSADLIDTAVAKLEERPDLDSVISVSQYPMFAPERARRENSMGQLEPYVDFRHLSEDLSCARQSHDKCFFADGGITVVRIQALEDISKNLLPFRWMGEKIGFIEQNPGGFDIDYEWQIPSLSFWLKNEQLA